ncbi:ABC transporter ATP-binding protein, partial [Nodularia sphaerocarpa]
MSSYQSLNKSDTDNRANNSDWRLFLRLLPYARRSRRLLTLAIVLLIPIALANAVQPLLIGQVISLIRDEPNTYEFLRNRPLSQGLNILQVLIVIAIVIRLVLTGFQGYLLQKLGQKITAAIRQDLFHHVTSLAVRFFDRTPIGKLITRLTSDVEVLGDVFSTGAIGIVSNVLSMLVIIGIMFSIEWKLACLLLVILLPITWLIIYFQQQYRKANSKAREELSTLNSQLQENVVGMNIVQLFRRERFNADLFRHANQRYTQQVDQTILYDSAVSATLEWIGLIAIAGVLLLGGWLLLGQSLSFGVLAAFILYAQRLFDPLREFAEKFTVIQAGFTSIERITDILDEPIEIRDGSNQRFSISDPNSGYMENIVTNMESQDFDPTPELGEIRFEHVWFAYKEDDYVIKDLDFVIHPGEKIALVGPTGAGKSSIIRLLCRLYEPTKGRILLDGVDIRELPQADLRRYMAVILQEGFLFAGDVKSNISLGDNYTFAQIQQAASKTNIAEFIEQLPQGYD